MACTYVYVIILTLLGPEDLGRNFDVDHDSDLAEATGKETVDAVLRRKGAGPAERDSSEAADPVKEDSGFHQKV